MILRFSKIFNYIITAVIIFLAFPATAILASWNSLPGSFMYPIKRNLEKTALALLPDSVLEMQLRFKLLDRRSNEASLAIIQQPSNNKPLEEIVAEAKNAQIIAMKLQPKAKQQTSTQLIKKLNQTSSQLDNLKQTITKSPSYTYTYTYSPSQVQAPSQAQTPTQTSPTTPIPPGAEDQIPTSLTTPTQTSPTTPINPDTEDDIIDAIDQAKDDLDDIIDDLQEEIDLPQAEPDSLDTQPQQLDTGTEETNTEDNNNEDNDEDKDKKGKKGKGKNKND